MLTEAVKRQSSHLAQAGGRLPAYIYDLEALRSHAITIREALSAPGCPEIYYAAKAQPDEQFLRVLAPYVDGIEVASGGELEHVRRVLPNARIAFGGPGKTDQELALALELCVDRIHVESPYELGRLARIAQAANRNVDILLRVNLPGDRSGAALSMTGPFGMDPTLIESCRELLAASPQVRLRGIHAHLASGLTAAQMVSQSVGILDWARTWMAGSAVDQPEINLGGGMIVDYAHPDIQFDWATYGKEIAKLALPNETLRIKPGRTMSTYAGWYVTEVLDVKKAHDEWYAVLRGGTMHLRTPVTRQHNQPCSVLPQAGGAIEGAPMVSGESVTLVGQLCTPKDVFAHQVPMARIGVGDLVAFAMAGAYAWNISHHDFLMHPKPETFYVESRDSDGT